MARPEVSVVMPFAGEHSQARAAIEALLELELQPGDRLILADNSGVAPRSAGIEVVPVAGERSPSHARNVGATIAGTDWILFIDADCRAPRDLLDRYFADSVDPTVGALAGEVVPAAGAITLASRYAGARSFLRQEAHLAHPYRPRAVAANLMVRRAAFEQVGGFYEGLRAAEDTDFCWRLQASGWRLELRPGARVEHRYRASVAELRRQWRGYAAGRAWLARRYDDFAPQPAVLRAAGRVALLGRRDDRDDPPVRSRGAPAVDVGRLERARFLALDALLGVDELAGLVLSNTPRAVVNGLHDGVQLVLIADRFPARDDLMVDFARTVAGARVEAAARPDVADVTVARELRVDYREDDGVAARIVALIRLSARHPARVLADVVARGSGGPSLLALAPAAVRLEHDPGARVHALRGAHARATARRLARLAGRSLAAPGTP